jgi:RsmE family RNA methyltransferase
MTRAERGATGRVRLDGPRAAHLIDVMGCEVGRRLRVGVVDGPMGEGRVVFVDRHQRRVEIEYRFDLRDQTVPPRPCFDLLLALPRPKVLGRILEHATTLGVGRIVLTRSWRVDKSYFQTPLLEPEGYRPRLLAGLEQACDTRLPEVHVFRRFKPLVEDHLDALLGPGTRLVARPSGIVPAARAFGGAGRAVVAIGPERGWTDYEVAALGACGFAPVSLGPRILRVETACTVALAQLAAATEMATTA